jgi:hypothetical protein
MQLCDNGRSSSSRLEIASARLEPWIPTSKAPRNIHGQLLVVEIIRTDFIEMLLLLALQRYILFGDHRHGSKPRRRG